jgi:outer membrane lipoprotein-sorting protein
LTEAGLPPILQALAGTQHFSAEEFDENYYIKPVVEEAIRDMAAYQLRFTPKGPEKETLVEYDLWVDQERYYPLRLVVRSKEETIAVDFLNARAGQPLPENIFDVRVPESAQWIDKTREF